MMKSMQDMMSKMSPEEMQKMMNMTKNMDPEMMRQAQQMMGNPAMMQQAQQAMSNMSSSEIKSRLNDLPSAPAQPPPPPQTAVAKLKASAMAVAEDVIELVEEAEGQKATGNARFKEAEYSKAISAYKQGVIILNGVLNKKVVSGKDKQAVTDLLDALQLNTSNCRLKLEEWTAAVDSCNEVLSRGRNRKAFFQRGKAKVKLDQLQDAHGDFKEAAKMDPSDKVVHDCLVDVEKRLGVKPSPKPTLPAAPVASSSSSAAPPQAAGRAGRPHPPGMPMKPDGTPDYTAMEGMLDSISPEQMKQQAEALENMSPEQLQTVAPHLAGMDPAQIKMMSKMMSGMDPSTMKSMAKMASQMQGAGGMPAGGMPAGGMPAAPTMAAALPAATAAGAATGAPPLAGGAPDLAQGMDMMSNMSPDMMQAGMEMMKTMDPKAMAEMSKSMLGREISEAEMEKMQSVMSKLSPEDMQKWAGRAQMVTQFAKKPLAAYQWLRQRVSMGTSLAVLVGLLGVMVLGHLTDSF